MAKGYGFIKSKIDDLDEYIKITEEHVKKFFELKQLKIEQNVPVFDLRDVVKIPEALSEIDQGSLGSCTANAISFAYAFDELKQNNKDVFLPSRLFIYYNERLIENTIDEDSGASLKDGMNCIKQYGVCEERIWPYDPINFEVKPSQEAYDQAKLAKAVKFMGIALSYNDSIDIRTNNLKNVLKSGFPIIIGIVVYDSFESQQVAETGMVPMPGEFDQIIGGHAVCIIGYNDHKQSFIVKNSWGPDWGDHGYFYLPYKYVTNPDLTSELWILQKVTDPILSNFQPHDIYPDAENINASPSNGGVVHN